MRIGIGKPPSKERGADHVLSKLAEGRARADRRRPSRPPTPSRPSSPKASTPRCATSTPPTRSDPSTCLRQSARDQSRLNDALMSLTQLPLLLRDEPGLTRAARRPAARIAVVEVARPIAIAALAAALGTAAARGRCPTGAIAGQLFDDLCQFMPDGEVVLFPAWETLPFERVSPSVETMGSGSQVLWRLRNSDHTPGHRRRGRARPAAAAGPGSDDDRADRHPAERRSSTPTGSSRRLSAFGYRREELVEHRGEFARRGADRRRLPVHRRLPDPHRPVGRRGRPAHRVRRQRSALDGRPRRGDDLPGPRADSDRRGPLPRRRPRRRRAVGS